MKNLFYYFTRFLLHLPFRIYLRKLHIHGEENFPKDKPVLLACNHPNSFLDGVVFEYFYRWRKIYTLARGDAFNKPVPNFILRGMRVLPIYRARDARADVARKGNAQTNEEVYSIFKKGHAVLIFPEGNSFPEKRLRPLKKGTGSIAVEMTKRNDYSLDLYVVPTAINYSQFGSMRRTVHITYGKPILMREYRDTLENNEREVRNEVTERVNEELQRIVVITEGEHNEEKEMLQQMMLNYNHRATAFRIRNAWKLSVDKLNTSGADLAELVQRYQAMLKEHSILDFHVGGRVQNILQHFFSIVTLGVSLPVFIVWWLLWKLVVKLTSTLVPNRIFTDSVILGVGLLVSFFYSLVVVGVSFILLPLFWAFPIALIALFGGVSWFATAEFLKQLNYQFNWWNLKEDKKEEIGALRTEILNKLR